MQLVKHTTDNASSHIKAYIGVYNIIISSKTSSHITVRTIELP